MKSGALLAGRIFDDRGNRMSPSHARKRGIKYRYYLSSALFNGEAEQAGSIRRVPAVEIETLVVKSVREHLKLSASFDDQILVNTHVVRIEVQASQLVIQFTPAQKSNRRRAGADDTLLVPWQKTPSTRRRELLLPVGPESSNGQTARPIRSETRATLVASIARGRRWLDEIIADSSANAETIATRES
jgi:site-specific DNA recombinase